MSEKAANAVFLSYASQDAAAARRICEALRAAGIEVWFDQSELVGGDAWDHKIRQQIKECALLVPVISKTTQGRREAYFRLEWRLADERTHLMAKGTPFLLPVTIDETSDRDALVPDSFLAVQWSKLPGGETPPAFVALVRGLLQGGPKWLKPILASAAIVIAVLAGTLFKNARTAVAENHPPAAPAPAVTPVSPARELVAKVYVLIRALETTREDFALAEEYCQRALKLDPDDGEVWAAYSQVHAAFGYRGWDSSSERREQVRVTAERAIRLAPRSVDARIALAGSWSTFGINREEREKLLREIVAEDPNNQGALRFLAVTVLAKPDGLEECLALNERSAALPGGDPLALFNNARYLWQRGRAAEGYATLQRALGQEKFTSGLVLKMAIEINSRGDLAAADETLRQIPPAALQEDRANYVAGQLRYYQRNGAGALEIWQAFPRDFYSDFIYDGPKGLMVGLADELDHREAAAATEWRAALQEVEKRIKAAPNKPGPYFSQAFLLACLGEKTAAGEALRTYEQLAGIKYPATQPMPLELAKVYTRLGRFDEIFAHPPAASVLLRINPDFDALRADPRFTRLLAEGASGPAGAPAAAGDKSVAVLAFANLSDDKANEYFSEGISEELLNVLAKIPDLKVSARTSAFSFKDKDVPVPEIAKQLGVAYVVEGSVRKQGDKVRITAQLIKAADGFHVWSDTFTRDLKDIFAVQDEIAGLVAEKLSLKLGVLAAPARPVDPEAYRLLTLGRALVYRATAVDGEQARRNLQAAVERDNKMALAWAWLSIAHWAGAVNGWTSIESGIQAARTAAERALALDPELPEANMAVGLVYYGYEWDWTRAHAAFQRALQLAPGDASIISNLCRLAATRGELEESIRLGRRAVELDPLNTYAQYALAMALLQAGKYDEMAEFLRDFSNTSPSTYKLQIFSRLLRGKSAEALQITEQVDATSANRPFVTSLTQWACGHPVESDAALAKLKAMAADRAAYQIAQLYAYRGAADDAFVWLEKSYALHDAGMIWLKHDPFLRNLHADPRWPVLLRKMNLADDQLK